MTHRPDPAPALDVEFTQQTDLRSSLAPLGRWGDDMLDRWDGETLVRTAALRPAGAVVAYAATVLDIPDGSRLKIQVPAVALGSMAHMEDHIRATLLTDRSALEALGHSDHHVRALTHRYPGVVPVLFPDPFAALIRSISAQQVNLRWAAVVRRRLAERYGTRHEVGRWHVARLQPALLAGSSVAELRELQLTTAKARSVIAVARAALAGELDLAVLAELSDEELIARLTDLPGIGRWSAEWFLARTLGRPCVVAGDLGVRKAAGLLYGKAAVPSESEVRRLTEHWGAAATHVQALALHALALGEL